jgi:putative tryptophan/tyrosine transport system substrate-binding protein
VARRPDGRLRRARKQAAMPVVGLLDPTSPATYAHRLRGFRKGLNDAGYVEGENVLIQYNCAENQIERLPALATDLVRRRVAVIATSGGSAPALAAKTATTTIPIVFSVGEDHVKLGLVASLARPEGNATGINFFIQEVVAKRLDLLRELVPRAVRMAVLVNPAHAANTESTLKEVYAAARAIKLQTHMLNASADLELMQPLHLLCASGPTCSSSAPIPFSSAGVSNWSNSRLGTRSLRLMRHVKTSKLAG